MKKFLISIDTEGDNLWKWKIGDPITTENARYLPRFQELCEKHGFKPTYLTNYEMATNPCFIKYFKQKNLNNLCEIGMHLHAWNSPPEYGLKTRNDTKPGAPYLIEYPSEIINSKVVLLTDLLENTFETSIITHRAGRWATNQDYFKVLDKYGYKVDCSVTPMMNWNNAPGQSDGSSGSDYTNFPLKPYIVENTDIMEIPVTFRQNHRLKSLKGCGVRKCISRIKEAHKGYGPLWLRPRCNKENLDDLIYLTNLISKETKTDYLMFMLHSSEFMPGGSPSFPDEESIEYLYKNLEILFNHIGRNYSGGTFREYHERNK